MPNRLTRNYMDDKISNGRRDRQRDVLTAIYASMGQQGREGFRIADLDEISELAKINKHTIGDFVRGLDRCDVIKARTTRAPMRRDDGHDIEVSRREIWLHLPEDQAFERLEELYEQEKRTRENLTMPLDKIKTHAPKPAPVVRVVPQPEPPVIGGAGEPTVSVLKPAFTQADVERAANIGLTLASDKSTEETRAIAGPEPDKPFASLAPLRKDEYAALIEAARQYANRKAEFAKVIDNLRAMGIEIDDAKLDKAVKFPSDPHMDSISEVLPYISRLEGMVENLTRQLIDARQRAVDYNEVKRERDSLRTQLQRKIAESIAARQRE